VKTLFFLLLFTQCILAVHIKWQSNYEASLQVAKEQNKDIFLLILKKDDKKSITSLIDSSLATKINKKFIPVVVFFENQNSYPIELFYTQTFPAIFFVSKEDETYLKKPLLGTIDVNDLQNELLF
jgi:hypothetical protein